MLDLTSRAELVNALDPMNFFFKTEADDFQEWESFQGGQMLQRLVVYAKDNKVCRAVLRTKCIAAAKSATVYPVETLEAQGSDAVQTLLAFAQQQRQQLQMSGYESFFAFPGSSTPLAPVTPPRLVRKEDLEAVAC